MEARREARFEQWHTGVGAIPPYWRHFPSLVDDFPLEASMLRLADGTEVHLYEAGPVGAPQIVLVSPAESPFLLFSRLFHELARHFRVAAWDNPACAFMDTPPDLPPPTLQRMGDDLRGIIDAREMTRAHIVTWCAGALIPIWTLSESTRGVGSVSFIAPPSVLSKSPERTGFQSHVLQSILELATTPFANAAEEEAMCQRILTAPRGNPLATEDDHMIYALTNRPVRDAPALRRYAKSILNACTALPKAKRHRRDQAYIELIEEQCTTVPMCLLHCRDDDIVSYKCSSEVVAQNDNVRLVVYPRGGHFVIYKQPDMLAPDIASFVNHVQSSV